MDAIEMFFLTADTLTIVLVFLILFVIYFFIFLYLILVTSCKMFKKAGRSSKEAFVPFYNIIVFLQIAEVPAYYFFTLLVPGLNVILLFYIMYRIGKLFKVSKKFMWGLVLCPIVFLPLLAYGDYIYKEPEEEVFTNISDEMPAVLSQAEIDAINKEEEKREKVDNIFKSEIKVLEKVDAYKANKVKVNEEFINEEMPEPIKINRVTPVRIVDINEKPKEKEPAKFIEEEIEIIDFDKIELPKKENKFTKGEEVKTNDEEVSTVKENKFIKDEEVETSDVEVSNVNVEDETMEIEEL